MQIKAPSYLKYCAIAMLVLIVVFLAIALIDVVVVNRVSPWHDELWNLYASFELYGIKNGIWPGCSQGMCVNIQGFSIPLLSGPYHGTLKTLIFSPLVLLGDVSLIRCLNVATYLAPLVYIWKQKEYFGTGGTCLINAAYYLLFTGLFFEAIFDQGQFIISNALFSVAAIELIKDLRSHNPRRLTFVILLSALAVYEKLTNIPVAFAFSTVAFISLLRNREFCFAGMSLLSFGFAIPYVVYLSKNMASFVGLTSAPKLGYLANLRLFGKSAYTYLLQKSFTISEIVGVDVVNRLSVLALLLLIAAWAISVIRCFQSQAKRVHFLTVASPLVALLAFPLFNGLYRPWHIYQLAPLVLIPFGYLAIIDKPLGAGVQKRGFVLLLAVLIVGLVNSVSLVAGSVNKTRIHPYDSSLLELAATIKAEHASTNLVCLDYSVCYNLALVLGSDYKLLAEWAFAPKEDICRNLENIKNNDYYLITHINRPGDYKNISHSAAGRGLSKSHEEFLYSRSKQFIEHCSDAQVEVSGNMKALAVPGYRVYLHHPQ